MKNQIKCMNSHFKLPTIHYCTLRFEFKATEDAELPDFKGSMLRGAFGKALRTMVCAMGPKQPCESCLLNRHCINTQIFETLIFDERPRFYKGIDVAPKPFIIYCDDNRTLLKKDQILKFTFTFTGNVVQYTSYVIVAMQNMSYDGLGFNNHRFELLEVTQYTKQQKWTSIYNPEEQILTDTLAVQRIDKKSRRYNEAESVEIQFLSPTRIKFDGQYQGEFDFRRFVFKMLHRILSLAHFYEPDVEVDWEFYELLEAASEIELVESSLKWKDYYRYSYRQRTTMKLGGFVGRVVLKGDILPFQPLLQASEILHVGKATTFGLGKLQVNYNGKSPYSEK